MEEIRLSSTDSVFSTDKEKTININLDNTGKKFPITSVSKIIDQYEMYRKEVSQCNKYRLTLTIKPYCTNVLFNTCTEIVANEGDTETNIRVVTDDKDSSLPFNADQSKICGKTSGLRRNYMLDNTEYSSEDVKFVYKPGYDIFGNHILRNLSFRSVIPLSTSGNIKYNTIEDVMRTFDGKEIKFVPRRSVNDTSFINKHIYERSNLLSMENGESVEVNLTNQNGWYGFINNSSIKPKNKQEDNNFVERDNNHVLNNFGNCEFIDMYPDRTLYSFTPKLNPFKHRMEKNWDIFITYPYKNFYNHNLVTNICGYDVESEQIECKDVPADQQINALLLMDAKKQYCRNGMDGVQFRSFCKHNLNVNDYIILYYSFDEGVTYEICDDIFRVNYVGDMKNENKEYYFAVTNSSIVDEIFKGRIEETFYDSTDAPPSHFREINGDITDIPQDIDTDDNSYEPNICKWYYEKLDNEPIVTWDNSNTVDLLPYNVQNGPTYIRLKKKINGEFYYDYYRYENNQYQLLDEIPSAAQFGDGNTFTDIPVGYVTEYIRVYQYDFYRKTFKYLIQKNEKVNDIVNSLLCYRVSLRFAKIVNGVKCKYYLRLFKKLPNLNKKRENLDNETASNPIKFNEYVKRNATKNGKMRNFENEIYPLAFSKTIYGDDITQFQYTETMDISYIRDNLNRPLTTLYTTIVKKNVGYKDWYINGIHSDHGNERVEYSHCFGKVTSGLDFLQEDGDDSDYYRNMKGFLSDGRIINNDSHVNNGRTLEEWGEVNMDGGVTNGILEGDEIFFGDIVEYNPMQSTETVLSDVNFRFNTAQREVGKTAEYNFSYKEIETDDYNIEGFNAIEGTVKRSLTCPEGYYHKAHYPMSVRSFSNEVKQASHYSVMVENASPIQMEGMFIRIETSNVHGYSAGRTVFICNDVDKTWYKSAIVSVDSKTSFIIEPISKDVEIYEGKPYINWIQLCNLLNDGTFKLRVKNEDIPDYADNVSVNLFLWRDIIPASESNDETMTNYPFANGALYIDNCINFYLKRQDPDGVNGLYYYGDFPDVEGKIKYPSNYEYIPEKEITC